MSKRQPKPDRRDNVDKLREQVVQTIESLEEAHTLQMNIPEEQKEAIREESPGRSHCRQTGRDS